MSVLQTTRHLLTHALQTSGDKDIQHFAQPNRPSPVVIVHCVFRSHALHIRDSSIRVARWTRSCARARSTAECHGPPPVVLLQFSTADDRILSAPQQALHADEGVRAMVGNLSRFGICRSWRLHEKIAISHLYVPFGNPQSTPSPGRLLRDRSIVAWGKPLSRSCSFVRCICLTNSAFPAFLRDRS
jgi:hypothetical protein